MQIELPILLLILMLFYVPRINYLLNALMASLVIIVLYILYDVFYIFLARGPRNSDLANIMLIDDFSPVMYWSMVGILLFLVSLIGYLFYIQKYNVSKRVFFIHMSLKVILLVGMLVLVRSETAIAYMDKYFKYYSWSEPKTIKKNGRFSSFVYYGIKRELASKKLENYRKKSLDVEELLFPQKVISHKRNLYIVILESFVDPRLIKDVKFNKTPLADNIKRYLNNSMFDLVISPIYGGGTSQAEFEVLTGVRALAKVNSIEFNTMEGCAVPGFIHLLKENGYNTYAVIGTGPQYYNAKVAYKSLGFEESDFLGEYSKYRVEKGKGKIFDGVLYQYVLQNLEKEKYYSPYIIYILGMYGHFPYNRDIDKQPDIISVTHTDARVKRIANQFYYRTKAMGEYIDAILQKDPDAIIYFSSDHLPPLFDKNVVYQKAQKLNIALLLDGGKRVDINGLYYYEIPRLIYRMLTGKSKNIKGRLGLLQEQEEEIYFKALSCSLAE
jgi:phosphoglycerol transferase MdoB-like AlkP superfamily enzyme